MGNLEKRRVIMFSAALSDTSFLYFKLSLFTVLFLVSSYFPYLRQDTYYELRKEADGVLLFFNTKVQKSLLRYFIELVQQNFWLSLSVSDITRFALRIVFSSFLKDAFVSVFTPSRYQSALSDGLISIVQEETLDESWIPVTEKEWREQQDSENEFITKKHTLIYTFGKGFIDAITSFGNLITDLWVKIIVGIQYLIEQKVRFCVSFIIFVFRSIICTFSSILLTILYSLQLVLRTTKQIYNIFQNGLFIACTLINDMSLLSVDVIQRTVVSQDEDIYIGLRQSALNSRNSIRRKTYVDPRSKPPISVDADGDLKRRKINKSNLESALNLSRDSE